MAVQYDKEKGFTTWLDLFESKLPAVSKEVDILFDDIAKGITNINGITSNDFSDIFDRYKITESREDLEEFLKSWNGIGDVSQSYQQWMIDNGKSTTTFSSLAKSASSVLKSFGAVLGSMGVNWAIGEVIGIAINSIDRFINSAKYASDAAQDIKEETSQILSDDTDRLSSLDELTNKYKELRESSNYDESTRKEVLNIQDQITDLVGAQGKGLDLVNGKLDEQLAKLKSISAEQEKDTLTDSENNYYATKDAGNKLVGDYSTEGFLGTSLFSESGYDFIYNFTNTNDKTPLDLWQLLKDAGYNDLFYSSDTFRGLYIKAEGNSPKEKEEYLQGILTTLREAGETDNELFRGVSSAIKKYSDAESDNYKAAQSYIDTWIQTSGSTDKNLRELKVNSVDDFEKYRKQMIEDIQGDKTVTDIIADGDLNKEDIENAVNDYMSTCEYFSTWYEKWSNGLSQSAERLTTDVVHSPKYNKLEKNVAELTSDYEKEVNKRKELYPGSNYVGNVDINNRPTVPQKDGSYATTKTSFQAGWYGDKKTGGYRIIHYTPILPDGTELDKDSLNKYIKNILNSSDPLEMDSVENGGKGIVYKVDTEVNGKKITNNNLNDAFGLADAWDNEQDKLQNKIYNGEIELSAKLSNAKEELSDRSKLEKDYRINKAYNSLDSDTKQKLLDAAEAGELTGDKINELANDNETLEDAFKSTGVSAEEFAESIREINIDNIQGDIDDCEKALKKMKDGQSLSSEETARLISKNDSLAGSIKKTKDGYKIEEDALISVLNTSKQKYNVVVANEILETKKVIESVKSRIKAYKSELKAIQASMAARQMEYNTITDGGTSGTTLSDGTVISPDDVSRALLGNPQAIQDNAKLNSLPKKISKNIKKLKISSKKLKELLGSLKDVDSSSDSSKDKDSSSKQEFDWIERRVTRLTAKISLLNAQKENLFTVKKKNANLDKQIANTTKLINTYSKAVTKYTKKANSVSLSASLKKQVQNGKITGSYKKLVKDYGEKTANKIQKYQDYYDKAKSAKQSKAEAKTSLRELQQEQYQNYVDYYDKKSARYQADRENATLKQKNKNIKNEIASTKSSYEAQIEIAELEKDQVTVAKLRAEQQKAINDLRQEEIDNVKALYDAQIQLLETGEYNSNGNLVTKGEQYYKNQIDLLESRGATVSSNLYKSQNNIEREKITQNEKRKSELAAKLPNVEKGTQQWYDLQSDISECDDNIAEAKKAINENSGSIRELRNTIDKKIDEFLDSTSDELDFISGLQYGENTDSDTGKFTDTGNLKALVSGLQIADGKVGAKYFSDQLTTLESLYSRKASQSEWDAANFYGYFNDDGTLNEEAVKEKIDELREESQKYIQLWIDSEKELIDLGKEKYEAQKEYLEEIIDAKKEMLELEKDLYDYEQNIAEKTKTVADIQKQLDAISGDDSEEGRARRSKLQVSLDEAMKDLQDTEYDRYISDQQNMLDNLYSEYEDLINDLFKDQDKILTDMLEYIKANEGGLGELFVKSANKYGYVTTQDLLDIVNTLKGTNFVISNDVANSGETGIEEVIGHKVVNLSASNNNNGNNNDNNSANNNNGNNSSGNTTVQNTPENAERMRKAEYINQALIPLRDDMVAQSKYWVKASGTPSSYTNQRILLNGFNGKKILNESGARALADSLKGKEGFKFKSNANLTKKTKSEIFSALNAYFRASSFTSGGIVDYKPKGEDGLAWVRNGEALVPPEKWEQISSLVDIVPDMDKFISSVIKTPDIKEVQKSQDVSVGDVNFVFELPNVVDAESLLKTIQTDKKIQRAIRGVSIDKLIDPSNLSVKRIL